MQRSFSVLTLIVALSGCGDQRELANPPSSVGTLATPLAGPAVTQAAPAASGFGPHTPQYADYKFAPKVHKDILKDRATELWGRVHYPQELFGGSQAGALPLVVFLHGNHGTCGTGKNPRYDFDCTYTDFGTCPKDHVVVHNHIGYDYLAERLASHGYLVVSINANRGITCGNGIAGDEGLNLARGRLVLKHLQLLSDWNTKTRACVTSATSPQATSAGVPTFVASSYGTSCSPLPIKLDNRIDFSQIGLMGHSRGGEGMRAVLHEYLKPSSKWPEAIGTPIWVRGIYEIGAVDGQTDEVLNAQNVAWNQLLPMCDGDVRFLDGIRPYDRMLQGAEFLPRNKSYFLMYGANHNFFNTEWQVAESPGCGSPDHKPLWEWFEIGSPDQRAVAISSVMAFFRAHLGPQANIKYATQFNPLYRVPQEISNITRIDRAYIDTTRQDIVPVVEDFRDKTHSPAGLPRIVSGVTMQVNPEPHFFYWRHDPSQNYALVEWKAADASHFVQTNFRGIDQGINVKAVKTLDFRVGRAHLNALNEKHNQTHFSVALVHGDDTLGGAVDVGQYLVVDGPGTGPLGEHEVLWTVRIPLQHFPATDLTNIRGVRFTFDQTETGSINLADIRASLVGQNLQWPQGLVSFGAGATSGNAQAPVAAGAATVSTVPVAGSLVSIKTVGNEKHLEIQSSEGKFAVTDALPVLEVGGQRFRSSMRSTDLSRLTFKIKTSVYSALKNGDAVKATVGHKEYALGLLAK